MELDLDSDSQWEQHNGEAGQHLNTNKEQWQRGLIPVLSRTPASHGPCRS